jgi:hypothetical protein
MSVSRGNKSCFVVIPSALVHREDRDASERAYLMCPGNVNDSQETEYKS